MELKGVENQKLELQNVQLLLQLIDSMDLVAKKLEDSYNKKNSDRFNDYKNEILNFQKKIDEILK